MIVELPSNVMIRKAGPAAWLSFLAVSWGIVTLAVGFIKNWYSLVILRVLLGVFEGVSILRPFEGHKSRPDTDGNYTGRISGMRLSGFVMVQVL